MTEEEMEEMDRREKEEEHRKKAEKIRHKLSDSSESSDIVSESVETAETTETVANSENRGIIYYGVRKEVAAAFSEAFEEMVAKFGVISTISAVEPLTGESANVYGSFGDHSGIIPIRFANKKAA